MHMQLRREGGSEGDRPRVKEGGGGGGGGRRMGGGRSGEAAICNPVSKVVSLEQENQHGSIFFQIFKILQKE